MKKRFLLPAYLLLLTSPLLVSAAGLVPCTGLNCTFCDLLKLLDNVIGFIFKIIFPLAAVMVVIGGFMIMFSAGNPGRAAKGKEVITAAIIGIVIALISWLVLDTIFKILVSQGDWTNAGLGPWNQLNCSAPAK
ncbi:MAG: pilin [Candidatus Wolfebacteria bacterium]|nr:pilin [Candidatus Wolfebacteria bacterium]